MKRLLATFFVLLIASTWLRAQVPLLVEDIDMGKPSSTFSESIAYQGKLVFTEAHQLWITDGSSGGTQMLKSFANSDAGVPAGFKELNNKLFFVADDGTHGREIWFTDGTIAGTQMLLDINNGTAASIPDNYNDYYLTLFNGKLFFAASDGVHGTELWTSDGTAANTQLITDINPGADSSINATSVLLGGIAATSNLVFFAASDGVHGTELWATDGSSAGTYLIKDINTLDSIGSVPQYFITYGDKIVFTARLVDGQFANDNIFISDGTSPGTFKLMGGSNGLDHAMLGNTLYFWDSYGDYFYATDGTTGGTALVTDSLYTATWYSNSHRYATFLTTFNNKLYFRSAGRNQGPWDGGLWESDGTPAGTHLVKEFDGVTPAWPTIVGGMLYFIAGDMNRLDLYKFDGSDSNGITKINYPGACKISAIIVQNQIASYPMTLVNNTLYFSNKYDTTLGIELYKLGLPASSIPSVNVGDGKIHIYPNPAENVIQIDCVHAKLICIYNMLGLLQTTFKSEGTTPIPYDVSNLPPGVYTLACILSDGNKVYGKFIKN